MKTVFFKTKKTCGKRVVPSRKDSAPARSLIIYEYQEMDKKVREEKLFLRCGLSLEDLAKICGKNRTRMSDMVNTGSGLSFNNYLNQYRVQYMLWLMRCNPSRTIEDLAMASGFGSQPTMNSAFRRFRDSNPRDIARSYTRQEKRRPLSKTPELELIPPQKSSLQGAQKLRIGRGGLFLRRG